MHRFRRFKTAIAPILLLSFSFSVRQVLAQGEERPAEGAREFRDKLEEMVKREDKLREINIGPSPYLSGKVVQKVGLQEFAFISNLAVPEIGDVSPVSVTPGVSAADEERHDRETAKLDALSKSLPRWATWEEYLRDSSNQFYESGRFELLTDSNNPKPSISRSDVSRIIDYSHSPAYRPLHSLSPSYDPSKPFYLYPTPVDVRFFLPLTTNEFGVVFKTVKPGTNKELNRTRTQLRRAFGLVSTDRMTNASNVAQVITNSPSPYVVLVGHNSEGQFHFLDGSTRPLIDLMRAADESHKVCILISCDAKRFVTEQAAVLPPDFSSEAVGTMKVESEGPILATSGEITFEVAIEIAHDLAMFLQTGPKSLVAISQHLENAQLSYGRKARVKVLIARTATVVGSGFSLGGFVYLLPDSDCKKSKTPCDASQKHR